MNFLDKIKDNSILIVDNNLKDKILDYFNDNNLLKSIKLMSFTELKKSLLYDYTNEAIYFVMNKYKLNYSIAKNYINLTYYINDEEYDNDKLKLLLSIKKDLESNNLLIKDKLFINLVKSKSNVYVYGFDIISKFNNYLLNILRNFTNVEIINKKELDYKHDVHEFASIDEEVLYVCESISKLISDGIDINKIYVANYSNEYYFAIHKYFNMYSIPYYIRSETKLYDTVMGKYFIDNLCSNIDLLLYKIRTKFDVDNNKYSYTVYNKITNLLNTYYWCDDITKIKDLIIAEAMNTSIPSSHADMEINTVNLLNNEFMDDEYVFLIGFNLGSIPKIKKDEDFINDNIKTDLMEKSYEENEINKNATLKVLKNIKNIIITYKDSTPFDTYFPSFIIDNNYLVNKKESFKYSNYSTKVNELLYSSKIDNLIKFNEYDENLDILASNLNINYKSYDNKFSGVNNSLIINKLNEKPLSYSTISNYYKCPFKFYLSYMFRLDKYEQTLDTFIGSLFHKVMEDCITNPSLDIDIVYDNFIEENKDKRKFTNKDLYYIEKLRSEVHFIVDNIREQYKNSTHDVSLEWHEESLTFNKDDLDLETEVNYILTGVIDKVLFVDNNAVIIDYKTGTSDKIDRDLFEFGINIQLPIYLYLLKNKDENINIVGMYLQHILQGLIRRDDKSKNKSIEDIRLDRLKLDGLTLDDEEKLCLFDSNYETSSYISGIKKKKDGSIGSKTRIMTYEDQDNIYKSIKTLLENAINDIGNAKFDIKPLVIEQKYVDGCKYCKYKDICFVKKSQKNYVEIKSEDGDDNE